MGFYGGIPSARERGIASSQSVGRLAAHPRLTSGEGDRLACGEGDNEGDNLVPGPFAQTARTTRTAKLKHWIPSFCVPARQAQEGGCRTAKRRGRLPVRNLATA